MSHSRGYKYNPRIVRGIDGKILRGKEMLTRVKNRARLPQIYKNYREKSCEGM